MVVGDTEPVSASNVIANVVFLSKEEADTHVQGYLDSGANAHMFKNKNVFEDIDSKLTTVTTACQGEAESSANMASVGKVKSLRYDTGADAVIDVQSKGIYCNTLVENLISVGKMCDTDHKQ